MVLMLLIVRVAVLTIHQKQRNHQLALLKSSKGNDEK